MNTVLNTNRLFVGDTLAAFHFLLFCFLVVMHTQHGYPRRWCKAINNKENHKRFVVLYIATWATMSAMVPINLHKIIVFICLEIGKIQNPQLLTDTHFIVSTWCGFVICLFGALNCWYVTYARDGKGDLLRTKLR